MPAKKARYITSVIVLTSLGCTALAFVILTPIFWVSCVQSWSDTVYPFRYRVFAGCQVKTAEGWMNSDRFHTDSEKDRILKNKM